MGINININLNFVTMEVAQRISKLLVIKRIEKMVKEKRECNDILQQISAVKKAIDGLSKRLSC
jgi:DNA-binding FrmR family transcriptional regulator